MVDSKEEFMDDKIDVSDNFELEIEKKSKVDKKKLKEILAEEFVDVPDELIDFSDAPVFSREEGFKKILNLLAEIDSPSIVEVGCIRQVDDIGAGNSTELFAWFVSKYGGRLRSCDISKKNVQLANSVVSKYSGDIHVIQMDGMQFLKTYKNQINFLYLDSYDSTPKYFEVAAQHHLDLFKVVENKLQAGCYIMIDDVYDAETFIGKGAKLIPYLLSKSDQYECLLRGYQFLFLRK